MKVFTAEDFLSLAQDSQAKVTAWLEKYDLTDISVLMCTSSFVPLNDDEILEHERVSGYSVIPVKRFNDKDSLDDYEYAVNSDEFGFGSLTKVVELNFNDFPWEVMEAGD